MARRRTSGGAVKLPPSEPKKETRKKRRAPELLAVAQLVKVGGRKFVTYGPDDPIWQDLKGVSLAPKGAFVRLRPPSSAEDETIKRVRWALEVAGCLVKVEPREAAPAVLPAEVQVQDGVDRPRDVVLALIDASSSERKDELRDYCDEVMVECDL